MSKIELGLQLAGMVDRFFTRTIYRRDNQWVSNKSVTKRGAREEIHYRPTSRFIGYQDESGDVIITTEKAAYHEYDENGRLIVRVTGREEGMRYGLPGEIVLRQTI